MAAPVYSTDLNDIYAGAGSTTNWTALGGGASGLNAETDYFIQGTGCTSKNAWASALKGMIYNNGSGVTIPTDGAVLFWIVHATMNSTNTFANGGVRVLVGSSTSAYKRYYVDGSDTNVFGGWKLAAVDPSLAGSTTDVGSPTSTRQYFGGTADMVGGPTKGSPFGIDAIRYGRCELRSENGETSNYATFLGANAYSTDVTRRWGLLSFDKGSYFMSGLFVMGTSGTAVDFRDSNRQIFIRDHDKVNANFNGFEVRNSSSIVQWTNISVQALGTVSKGRWVTTAGTVTLTDCQFTDMNTFDFLSSGTMSGCTWRRCNTITAPGTTMTTCQFRVPSVAADTAAVIWDTTTDTDGKLDGSTFTKGTNAHHAIRFSQYASSFTLRNLVFSGFHASDGNNDSALYFPDTGSDRSWTVNLVGCTGNISFKKVRSGDTVTLVIDPVSLNIHVQDIDTGSPIVARIYAQVSSNAGGEIFEAAVTSITRSGTTATCTTTSAHNLVNNDVVRIKGADQYQYNGVFVVTVTGGSTFTYTMASDPGSSATGTPTVTFALMNDADEETNGSGDFIYTHSWSANQPFTGRARSASGSTKYKTAPFSGTINSSSGVSITVNMIKDQ